MRIYNPLEILRGLKTTISSVFEGTMTVEYPEERKPMHRRFRGRHNLQRYDNGLERCIGCALCAAACPADAIFVEASENSDDERYSPGDRYASTYEINMMRCIFCGYCEDACPTEAIVLEHQYELSFTDRRDAISVKELLIVPVPDGGKSTPQKVPAGMYNRAIPQMKDPV